MEQKLFTEVIPLYRSHEDNPYVIRIHMRLRNKFRFVFWGTPEKNFD